MRASASARRDATRAALSATTCGSTTAATQIVGELVVFAGGVCIAHVVAGRLEPRGRAGTGCFDGSFELVVTDRLHGRGPNGLPQCALGRILADQPQVGPRHTLCRPSELLEVDRAERSIAQVRTEDGNPCFLVGRQEQ